MVATLEMVLRSILLRHPDGRLQSLLEGAFSCMKAAYDAGINFFDCAEGYAEGQSEIVMGEAIKKFEYVRSRLWFGLLVTDSDLL